MPLSHSRDAAKFISRLCGWSYVIAWSLSFYPQPLLNLRRRSVEGLTRDFPTLNVIGFGSYSLSTFLFLYSTTIRDQYAARHPTSPEPTVRFNDLAFGVHGLILCCITVSQFWPRLWGWSASREPSKCTNLTYGLIFASLSLVCITTLIVLATTHGTGLGRHPEDWAWIDVTYSMTYVKLTLTVFKYIPQVIANHRAQSTLGWSINQVLFDFAGGILSLVQLVIDSALQADWSGLYGNPVKFGLANISMIFDVIFITQHFVLYGPVSREKSNGTDDDDTGEPTERDALITPPR